MTQMSAPAPRRVAAVRHRLRTNRATRLPWRIGIFVLGLFFVALGIALAALPGPLTIPPVLLGVWIWSTEFAWADRFFDKVREQAREAWAAAKARPRTSALVTFGGLAAAGAAVWAAQRYEVLDRTQSALGF